MFIVFALLVRPIAGEHVAVVSVKLQLLPARDVWMIMCFYAVLGDRRGFMSLVSLRKSKLYFSCAHASNDAEM